MNDILGHQCSKKIYTTIYLVDYLQDTFVDSDQHHLINVHVQCTIS